MGEVHYAELIWAMLEAKEMAQLMDGLLQGPLPEELGIRGTAIIPWVEPSQGDYRPLSPKLCFPKAKVQAGRIKVLIDERQKGGRISPKVQPVKDNPGVILISLQV